MMSLLETCPAFAGAAGAATATGSGDCSSSAVNAHGSASAGGGANAATAASVMLSLEPHKAVPAPFLTKTYQLVDDPSTDHIVSWGDDNSTFVVWRPPEFARDLLPNYFKHNNFSSFVRQLNTYGFRKIVPERWEFANEFFRKGEKHLLCEIHRRKTSTCSSPTQPLHHLPFQTFHHHHPSTAYLGSSSFPPDDFLSTWCDSSSSPRYTTTATSTIVNGYVPMPSPSAAGASGPSSPASAAAASALLEDNERLRRSNAMLLSELAHMRKLYNDIIYFVQNHVRPVAPSNSYPSSLLLGHAAAAHHQYPTPSPAALRGLPEAAAARPKQQQQQGGCLGSGGSTTSSSSLTIAEEPTPTLANNNGGGGEDCFPQPPKTTKLFGVPLVSSPSGTNKKRPFQAEEFTSATTTSSPPPVTRARFMLNNDDLGFNLMPPSSPH